MPTLAKRLLNNPGLVALTCEEEQFELKAVGRKAITLKRTFNQEWPDGTVTKFWRVLGPEGHSNLGSDLSLEGLVRWGIVKGASVKENA